MEQLKYLWAKIKEWFTGAKAKVKEEAEQLDDKWDAAKERLEDKFNKDEPEKTEQVETAKVAIVEEQPVFLSEPVVEPVVEPKVTKLKAKKPVQKKKAAESRRKPKL